MGSEYKMNERFRDKIWRLATRNLKMGYMLPKWAIWLRCFLFPLDSFYWKMSGRTGYQMPSDSWLIDGIMYHRAFFKFMENANGELVRIKRVNDLIQIEKIKEGDIEI